MRAIFIFIIIFILFFYLFIFFNRYVAFFLSFDGRVVAKLPFVPHSWLQGLSHRNLMGNDFTDCSFIFLYILCTMSVRQVCIHWVTCNQVLAFIIEVSVFTC